MIAVGFVAGWTIILVACCVLWALWGIIDIVADMLQRWWWGR